MRQMQPEVPDTARPSPLVMDVSRFLYTNGQKRKQLAAVCFPALQARMYFILQSCGVTKAEYLIKLGAHIARKHIEAGISQSERSMLSFFQPLETKTLPMKDENNLELKKYSDIILCDS